MAEPNYTAFEHSLKDVGLSFLDDRGLPEKEMDPRLLEAMDACRRHGEALAVRKQIDSFLVEAGRFDEIAALLLTIITEGRLFAYNRALLLLQDQGDAAIRGYAGIGSLSREETWHLWAAILSEDLDLVNMVRKAVEGFRESNRRLAPILERLVVPEDLNDAAAAAFRGRSAAVLQRNQDPGGGQWVFDILGTDRVGVLPMWGYYGQLGVLLVDNFASDRSITEEGLGLLEAFVKPFVSALEKAIVIENYQEQLTHLKEANACIEAQREMLLRIERRNTVGRFTATLAHNLLNPVLSMSGHLAKLRERKNRHRRQDRVLDALAQDMRDLEDFLGDFISQVEKEFPQNHFWDLNHIVGEQIVLYRRFHNILTPSITVKEGDIPLLKLDYEKVSSCLARLFGILSLLTDGLEGLVVTTEEEGPYVHLCLRARDPLKNPSTEVAARIESELDGLEKYLSDDQVGLVRNEAGYTLVFRT